MRVLLAVTVFVSGVCFSSMGSSAASSTAFAELLKLDYQGFTVWVDCARRGAVRFAYTLEADQGSLPREDDFELDPDVPAECQQAATRSYRLDALDGLPWTYDRGHLVPANHLDGLEAGIRQSNFMTNILPQASAMNRGAWLVTEEIAECWRDVTTLQIQGGVLWGWNPHDDFFRESHGIATPDYFWKVISRDGALIAWIIPNSPAAKRSRLDHYRVTPETIERAANIELDIPPEQGESAPATAWGEDWALPAGCDKG